MIVTDSTYDWLTWGLMDCPHGRLSPDLLARMEVHRTRAASLPLAAARLPIGWSHNSTLRRRSTAAGVRLRSTWRRVSRFIVNDQRIYLEAFGGIGGGPGFGFRDVRIYVDDELVGRAWSGGCALGFGGSSGAAVALLRDDCAVRVTVPNASSGREWERVDLLGRMDAGAVQDFLAGLPKPKGLNSRARRALGRSTPRNLNAATCFHTFE